MDEMKMPIADLYGAGRHPYRVRLRRLDWSVIRLLLNDSMAGWTRHNTPRLGAALAFYTLLSLMPLLLIVISIAGLVFGTSAAQAGVLREIQNLVGEQRARIVQVLLEGTQNKADGFAAAALGTVTLIFGASGMLMELRAALNSIWDVEPRPLTTRQEIANMVKQRLWSFALVLAIGILLTGSLLFSTWISAAGSLYASMLPSLELPLHFLNALFSFVVVTGLIAAVYKIMPETRTEWYDVMLGAAVTSILFAIGNELLGLYLGKASFASTYGAAASSVVFAVWVYYSSQIFFLGAEFTKAFAERYGSRPSPVSRRRLYLPRRHGTAGTVPCGDRADRDR